MLNALPVWGSGDVGVHPQKFDIKLGGMFVDCDETWRSHSSAEDLGPLHIAC